MRKTLEEAAAAVAGRGISVVVEGAVPSGGDLTAAAAAADPKVLEKENLRKRAATDERVMKVLDILGGQIVDVRKDEGER